MRLYLYACLCVYMFVVSICVYTYIYIYVYVYSTRSPFLSLLPRSAQYGRCFSFGKRVWFTESHIVLFTQFIFDKLKKGCSIKLSNKIIFYENNTVTCAPSLTPLVRD